MTLNRISIDWEKMQGLVPVIIQDFNSRQVLMLGYMNEASLEATYRSGFATFYSRSKQRLWQKGESSGNVLRVIELYEDCDSDAILILANPAGSTCHKGSNSCFGDEHEGFFPGGLERVIDERMTGSGYTASMFEKGCKSMAQKVGEEGVEVALAALEQDDDTELLQESADLLFHLTLLLRSKGLKISDVEKVLIERHMAKTAKDEDN